MKTKKIIQFGAFLSAMLMSPQQVLGQDSPDYAVDVDEVVAIIGGQESSFGRFPATTALLTVSPTQNLFQRQFCAGTAISDSHILTAAHCMFNPLGEIKPDELVVAGNFIDLLNDSPAEIEVAQIFVHPGYDNDAFIAEHDIAILRTQIPHNIPPITLFNGDARDLTGVDALIAGWGVVQVPQFQGDDPRFPSVLNEAQVPVTDFDVCNGVYQGLLSEPHLCAGFERGGVDACQGDSGGPLMIEVGGELLQIGVTSFGNGCALPNAYGVYANIELYESFISGIVPEPSNGRSLFASDGQVAVDSTDGEDNVAEEGEGSQGSGENEDNDEEIVQGGFQGGVNDSSTTSVPIDNSLLGVGSADRGLLLLLILGAALRMRRSPNALGVMAAAVLSSGCVTDLPASTDESSADSTVRNAAVSNKSDGAALVKPSSDHKNLPMFDGVALTEKRAPAIELAAARYGVDPVCEGKKVAPKDTKRADYYERCDFVGLATEFEGGTIQAVTYHFMSNRIVQIDATLHGPAFVLSPMANSLDEILGESVFSVGETDTSAGGESLPQAVYHWSDPDMAYARLMTEAGADTESFLLSIQHPRFTDVIAELPALD